MTHLVTFDPVRGSLPTGDWFRARLVETIYSNAGVVRRVTLLVEDPETADNDVQAREQRNRTISRMRKVLGDKFMALLDPEGSGFDVWVRQARSKVIFQEDGLFLVIPSWGHKNSPPPSEVNEASLQDTLTDLALMYARTQQ